MAHRLPTYFVNADDVLHSPLPDLIIGSAETQTTTTSAGPVKKTFVGKLAHWDTFEQEVSNFMNSPTTQQHLALCNHLPICPADSILLVNPDAMAAEHMKVGAEITLSARFLECAMSPVVSSVKTMTRMSRSSNIPSGNILPWSVEFGDSWIVERRRRPPQMHPDIVSKVNDQPAVCLIGEVKFVVMVDLEKMVGDAHEGTSHSSHRGLSRILGQVYEYMLSYRTRFAFISNYNSTVFLQITALSSSNSEPCLFFSDVILHRDCSQVHRISVRSGLTYLLHKTGATGAYWQLSDNIARLFVRKDLSESKNRQAKWCESYSRRR